MTTFTLGRRSLPKRLATASTLLLSILFVTIPSASVAQEADALFRDFEPFGEMQAFINGEALAGSEVFVAKRAGSYLVLAPQLEQAVLVNARTKKTDGIATDKVRKTDAGLVDVLADATFDPMGTFEIVGDEVVIQLSEDKKLTLGPRPDLLGKQKGEGLLGHNPGYGFKAGKYPPSADDIAKLKKESRDVVVRVYFGSWCSTCSRIVPWILKVEQELAGSAIQFEYYGLPHSMDDPQATAMDVHGVPTMVVLIDGKEVGRRGAEGLAVPEKAILEILAGGA